MKTLELTERKAKDLNELCQFAADFAATRGFQNSVFDISYYQRQKPHYEIEYLRHLLYVAKQFQDVNKLLHIDGVKSVWATHNTKEFLKSGGFLRILEIEKREDDIQDFTRQHLKQSVFATKSWWIFFAFTTTIAGAIAIIASIITTLSTDRLSQKSTLLTPSQDSLLKSLAAYILTRDTSHHHQVDTVSNPSSYKNNFKSLQIDKTRFIKDTTQ